MYFINIQKIRACSDFGFEAGMSKFCVKEGKICSCSRVSTAKILTHFKIEFAVRRSTSEIRTRSKSPLLLFPQRPAQDLTHIGLGQLGSEFHLFGHFVAREVGAAVFDDFRFGE